MPDKGFRILRHTRLFMFIAIGLYYITLSSDYSFVQKSGLFICSLVLFIDHFLMYRDWGDRGQLLLCLVDFIAASVIGVLFNAESNLYLIYYNIIAVTLFFETSNKRVIRTFLISFFLVWLSILIHGGLVRKEWHVLDDLMNVCFVLFGCTVGYLVRKLMLAREMVAEQYEKLNGSHLALQEAHEQLGNYAKQVEDLTAIQERNRIARDIHDTVGHKMTALLIQLQLARELVIQKKEEGVSTLEICETIARDALQELRVSVQTLRAEGHASMTFQESIKALLQEFSSRAQIVTTLKIEGDPSYISTSIQPTLKRMIQESLTNAVRHGNASQCSITIMCTEDKISCSIQDNGKGESHVKPGFGLVNMSERVTQHGGKLRVESEPGKGFILHAEFPLRQQQWQLGGAV